MSKCKSRAETREKNISKKGSCSWFVKERGIFYRKYQSNQDDGKVFKQLLVPTELKNDVLKLAHDSILSFHMDVRKKKDHI